MRGLIFPLVTPLSPSPPRLCIVLQRSCTLLAVPRHRIYGSARTLGPIFFQGFQDRSEVGSELRFGKLKATLHAPVFIDKVMSTTERHHLQQTHFLHTRVSRSVPELSLKHTRANRLYVIALTGYSGRGLIIQSHSCMCVCVCVRAYVCVVVLVFLQPQLRAKTSRSKPQQRLARTKKKRQRDPRQK